MRTHAQCDGSSAVVSATASEVDCHPGWFGEPANRLFGWLARPAAGEVRGGVVLCPPLAVDYYASHATYRRLAEQLAGAGVASLRFDYLGTGDSGGRPGELATLGQWIDDIGRAVHLLRSAGTATVGLVGMRMGALLAAEYARTHPVDHLVLWDPCLSGRAFMRQSRLLLEQGGAPSEPGARAPGAEVQSGDVLFGYDLEESLLQELAGLRLDTHPPSLGPTLVLTRSGTLGAKQSGWAEAANVEVGTATGQPELLETFLDAALIPQGTVDLIVDRIVQAHARRGPGPGYSTPASAPVLDQSTEVGNSSGHAVAERVCRPAGLFGIETGPGRDEAEFSVLFVSGGVQTHIGPNRLHAELARDLASDGVRCVRFDFLGLGDSPPGPLENIDCMFGPGNLDDLRVLSDLAAPDAKNLAVVGLCSGGYHALETGWLASARGVVAVHPSLDFRRSTGREHLYRSDRRIWIPERGWMAWLDRSRIGLAVKWHLPAWAWRALSVLRLQPDYAGGIVGLAAEGTEVVVMLEPHTMRYPWLWNLRRSGRAGLRVEPSPADHSLVECEGRAEVAARIRSEVLRWKSSLPAR